MRVWVTRARPEAARTAERLIASGHKPLVSPLLSVHRLDAGPALAKALGGAGSLAFTSANGVRAFAALRPLSERGLVVFAVGQATARAAREAGFVKVVAGEGDAAALAKLIAAHAERPDGAVLHPGPLEPAGDLVGALRRRGADARAVAVYETRPEAPSAEALGALDQDPPGLDAILVHSARAAGVLAGLVAERERRLKTVAAVCISKAAAKPLAGLPLRRLVAEAPTEAAMIARLQP